MTDTAFSRDTLAATITTLDTALVTVTALMHEASDPKALRKDVLAEAAQAYAKLMESRKHVSAAFAAFGVRPA